VTVAPLVVKDKVIVGVAGAEYGIRGFIDAYDVSYRQAAVAFLYRGGTRRAGRQHLAAGSDAYLRGGGSIWVTGTYDPEQNSGVLRDGQSGSRLFSAVREGDNLYTASVVALDADTGKIKWHFQFTPHDVHDWDSTQVPSWPTSPSAGSRERRCCLPIAMASSTSSIARTDA
jgi:alcohol dehydrogenase (cytochrome c)